MPYSPTVIQIDLTTTDTWPHPQSNIHKYQEAVSKLEDVQLFLDSRGHSGVATKVGSLMDTVVSLQYESLASSRQATLDEFLYYDYYMYMNHNNSYYSH